MIDGSANSQLVHAWALWLYLLLHAQWKKMYSLKTWNKTTRAQSELFPKSPSAAWWMDHTLSQRWAQPVPQSDVDTTFVKVTLRSPSLICLFSSAGEVAGAFVEKVFYFWICRRSRLFWAMLTFKGWIFVTKMCSSDLVSCAHPSCCVVAHSVALEFHWCHDPSIDVRICSSLSRG